MSPSVFISCGSDTQPLAIELMEVLRKEGIRPWATFQDLRPGRRVFDEIERAIHDADWYLVLVRPQSPVGPWQDAEWRAALANTWADPAKRVLPLVIGDNKVPAFLRTWVPLRIDPKSGSAAWTDRVLEILRSPDSGFAQELSDEDKREREQRFAEMRKEVEELEKFEVDDRPLHLRS